jgi:hypothetical protein
MAKIRSMGFKSGHFGLVTKNDATGYDCESTVYELPELRSSSGDFNISDINIDADDATYYKGKRLENGTITLTLAELSNELYARLTGQEYSEEDQSTDIATFEKAPEIWFGAASEQLEGGFNITQFYACRCSNVANFTRQTKGADNTTGQDVEITLEFAKRKFDGKPGKMWESRENVSLAATAPATQPEGEEGPEDESGI